MAKIKHPFNIRLREDLLGRLRCASAARSMTMTALIEAALDKFLPAEDKDAA